MREIEMFQTRSTIKHFLYALRRRANFLRRPKRHWDPALEFKEWGRGDKFAEDLSKRPWRRRRRSCEKKKRRVFAHGPPKKRYIYSLIHHAYNPTLMMSENIARFERVGWHGVWHSDHSPICLTSFISFQDWSALLPEASSPAMINRKRHEIFGELSRCRTARVIWYTLEPCRLADRREWAIQRDDNLE